MSDSNFGVALSHVPLSKVTRPVAPLSEVIRRDFIKYYDSAEQSHIILVHAPAGFGKTTAMVQLDTHIQNAGVDTAWLTLDRSDNDVARFMNCLKVSIQPWIEDISTEGSFDIFDFFAQRDKPFAIFLDDFETLRAPSILALLRSIIESLPFHGQLIIGSRVRPDIGIARLRVRGRILELDPSVLRFNIMETLQYFQLRKLKDMPIEWLQRLHEKTEGWIAALWLASLSMERTGFKSDFVERFSITDKAVADFLADDVLAHQPQDIREFLLKTSVLKYLEPELCQVLVPKCDASSLLSTLENQNIFLTAIANQEPSYRYHSLFARFLRSRLRTSLPGEIDRLHIKAASWYEQRQRFVPAIDHAIDAGDYAYALKMLNEQTQLFLEEGRMRMLARWFRAIPDKMLASYAELKAASVWAFLFTLGPLKAHEILQKSNVDESDNSQVLAHVNAQRPLLLAMADRYDEALEVGRENLKKLPTSNRFADSVLQNAMANIFTVMGNSIEAQRLIDSARSLDGDSIFTRMYAESQEGLLNLQAGRLRQATICFRMAVKATSSSGQDLTSGNAWAGILYAGVLYESHDIDNAEKLVDVYLPLACDVGLPDHMYLGHMIKARIAYYRGEVDRAYEALTELEYLAHNRHLSRIVSNAKLERSRILLLQGDAQGAKDELERARDENINERLTRQRLLANELNDYELATLRWRVHFDDPHLVSTTVDEAILVADKSQRPLRAIKLRLFRALLLQRKGDAAMAIEAFAEVCRQAYQEDNIRIIADEGEQLGQLAKRYHAMLEEMPARNSNPKLLGFLVRLVKAFGDISVLENVSDDSSLVQMEALTRKEIKVLEYTAMGYSNAELAQQLALSDSTVRTHLRNINAKLNTRSRAEAVAKGRRLSIIR